jgi:hypothetical protein
VSQPSVEGGLPTAVLVGAAQAAATLLSVLLEVDSDFVSVLAELPSDDELLSEVLELLAGSLFLFELDE